MTCDDKLSLSKCKYLVQSDLTVAHFMAVLRRHLVSEISPEQGLFLMIGNRMSCGTTTFGTIEHELFGADGDRDFVEAHLSVENTFGHDRMLS